VLPAVAGRDDRARLEVLPIPVEFGGDTTYGVLLRRGKHRSRPLQALLAVLAVFDAVGGPAREPTAAR
jgi:hypothetical protein